ncbi:hypothetical protein L6R46_16220 [Myxococcota bacterium]|nr:hypothetical protein [Myxococcota bacterium]
MNTGPNTGASPPLAKAWALLTVSVLTRTLREGLVLRALIWPALIIALTLLVSATFVAGLYASKSAAVPDEAFAEVLVAKGLDARVYADPEAAFVAGEVDRAAFEGPEGWVILARFDGAYTMAMESELRARLGAAWRPMLIPRAGRNAALGPTTRLLVGLLAVLFVLYGVVFGAGGLSRDQQDGSLDAERALPVPSWIHAASRMGAAGLALSVAFAASVWLIHTILGVSAPWAWSVVGGLSGLGGAAMGLGLMARAGRAESLSGPLSRGLVAVTGLMALGYSAPALGRHLPIASVGALVRGDLPGVGAVFTTLLVCGLAAWMFDRSAR